ncbi:SDR family oxidoreductase [Gordonia sp. HY002]|uniref:SDR family oxidoreductase n=1 Tax=Gordonia zhenghanii TaxID=2911516 RepID=UPI001EEFAB8F|nr:SDR family oxidoreductase [Gordonia zhenghanii]MCF8572242.1 SDR family oxidoreductase [Gordonia zhenghanii]MCF8605080.1 SDR family oxidoreductase [Gordonia zhenghanii]
MSAASQLGSVDGTTVIITGGARGIGAATARLFADRGATVWIGDVDTDVAAATADDIPRARSGRLDVTSPRSWQQFVDTVVSDSGPIDILVNNAGVMPLGALTDETDATTDLILDVNVKGMLNGIRAVVPQMVDRRFGHIVNVASMAGMIPIPGMVTYNASKFAALGASLAARREYAGTGVSISAILPAAVRTELASGAELGGGMPTVDPDVVAAAIVKTVRTQAARTSVPRWVAPGWSVVNAFVPESIQNVARRLLDDRRALRSIDADGRRTYSDRIDRQTRAHCAPGPTSNEVGK